MQNFRLTVAITDCGVAPSAVGAGARNTVAGDTREKPVIRNPVEARAGVTGHNVRYVLAWGTAGVAIAFVIIYFIYFL
jgi:hypothetical protein